MQHNVEGGARAAVGEVEQVLKRNKLFSEHRFGAWSAVFLARKTLLRHYSTVVIHYSAVLHADKGAEEKSHLVTLNEVLSYFFQEGESFPHSYHKRWKIIMHIKARVGGWKRRRAGMGKRN